MNNVLSQLEQGHKVTIILGIIVLIIFLIGIYNEAFAFEFEDGDYTYACKSDKCFKVYYRSMERQDMIDYCELGNDILGCHKIIYGFDKPPINTIALEKGHEFDKALAGCTVFEHELFHAWGYHEQMIQQFFPCDQSPLLMNSTLTKLPHTGFWK